MPPPTPSGSISESVSSSTGLPVLISRGPLTPASSPGTRSIRQFWDDEAGETMSQISAEDAGVAFGRRGEESAVVHGEESDLQDGLRDMWRDAGRDDSRMGELFSITPRQEVS